MGTIKTYGSTGAIYLNAADDDRELILSPAVIIGLESALGIKGVDNTNISQRYSIFTSSNKPSGSYIGDGSTNRTLELNTDGLVYGGIMIITCEENNTCVIVTPNGSFVCDSGGVTYLLQIESATFAGPTLVLWNNSGAFNYDGDTYEYFVL